MSVKKDVLRTLEENRGSFFSGEELAANLFVSRTAIWKSIKQLEEEGYQIEAVPNRGYCLSVANDLISEEGIRPYLRNDNKDILIYVDKVTESTNQNAKLAAMNGATHGTVYLAEEQTAGKGRRGRSFVSMKGSGIYMSVLLKPQISAADAIYITTAASVAVYRAILTVTGKRVQIKWVNDLFYQGRKIAGILTEAITDCETGRIESIILGIGINFTVKPNHIPKELDGIAGALYEETHSEAQRNQLIAEIINQVLVICMQPDNREFLQEYRENSMIIGEEILVIGSHESKVARALGIDENGGLQVEYVDGRKETINTGEVSIRTYPH